MSIKFRPEFKMFVKSTAKVLAMLATLVLVALVVGKAWDHWNTIAVVLQLDLLLAVAVAVLCGVAKLAWWIFFSGIPGLLRQVFDGLPPHTSRTFPKRGFVIGLAAAAFVAMPFFAQEHFRAEASMSPLFAKFKISVHIWSWDNIYVDENTLNARDREIERLGFVLLPWTGWWAVQHDACGERGHQDCIYSDAVYFRKPWS